MKNSLKRRISILTAAILTLQLLTAAVVAEDPGLAAISETSNTASVSDQSSPPSNESNASSEASSTSSEESSTSSEASSTSSEASSTSSEESSASSEASSSSSEGSSTSSEASSSSSEGNSTSSEPSSSSSEGSSSSDGSASSEPPAESLPPDDAANNPASQPEPIMLASFVPLAPEQAQISVRPGTPFEEISLPESLTATDTAGAEQTISGVTWGCPAYQEAEAKPGNKYNIKAVLPDGYQLANGVEPPVILLTISGPTGRAINDRIIINHAIYKEINPTEAQLIGYEKTDGAEIGELVIPAKITNPIDGHELTVISVEDNAFQGCKTITSVKFEGNPKIGEYAFSGSKVASIDFGSELDNLGRYAFSECEALAAVTIPGRMKTVNEYAFAQSGLQSVVFEPGVQSISNGAFYRCLKISSVTFPTGMEMIGQHAFNTSSALKEVTLPGTLTDFYAAFCNGGLEKVTLSEGITSVSGSAFLNCNNLKEVNLPSSLVIIGGDAFRGCTVLESISLNDGLQSIGYRAFYECSALAKITLPKTTTTIWSLAFSNCQALKEVNLPDGLKYIGDSAFSGNTALVSIAIPNSVILDSTSYNMFYNCTNLETVTLPAQTTILPYQMFYGCKNLKKITLPETLEFIGFSAFRGAGLTEIVIPDNVNQIERQTFIGCTSLTTAKLPAKLEVVSSQLFGNCTNLKAIELPSKITSIDTYAFENSGLETITIPESVKIINSEAFRSCTNLTEVTLKSTSVTIASQAFYNCIKLAKVQITGKIAEIANLAIPNNPELTVSVPDEATAQIVCDSGISPEKIYIGDKPSGLDPAVFEVDTLKYSRIQTSDGTRKVAVSGRLSNAPIDLTIPAEVTYNNHLYQVTEIGKGAFAQWNALRTVTISEGIEAINQEAFYNCNALQTVNFPTTLKRLDSSVFHSCSSLKEITIPEGVEILSRGLFCSATALEKVELPNSLKEIGPEAFSYCISLQKITLPQNLTTISNNAFSSCTKLEEISLPDQVSTIGSNAFSNCTALKSIKIPEEVQRLDEGVFASCTDLSSVILPKNLKVIGKSCFGNTPRLKSITLPKGLQSIGESAFSRSGLDSIQIPEGVYTIYPSAFSGCVSLKSVSFPSTLNTIMHYAFSDCTALETVEVPENVSTLGPSAFSGCSNLKKAVIKGNITTGSYYYNYSYYSPYQTFIECSALEEVTLSGTTTNVVPLMFYSCTSLKTVNLSNGTQTIGDNAFYGCKNLNEITLPNGRCSVGSNAFAECTGLSKVTMPYGVYSIGSNAFDNTPLESVTLPDSVVDIQTKAFYNCPKLAWAKIGKGLQFIGKNAFPTGTQLIANDPRVQLLLVEYLNQDENKRPASEWGGQSDVKPGAIAAVNQDVLVTSSVTIAEKAEVTLYERMSVSGKLDIQGKFKVAEKGRLILLDGGQITGPGAKDLPIYYPLLIPEWELGEIAAPNPFYQAGETVKLEIKPASGCRLKEDTLRCNGTAVKPDADGLYTFQMPAATARITAEFEAGLRIEGKDSSITSGESAVFRAVFPSDVDTTGAVYHWTTDDRLGTVTLSNTDSPEVTVAVQTVPDDIDTLLKVSVTVKGKTLTAERNIRLLAIKSIRINEAPSTPFRPGETLQLTAKLGEQAAVSKQIIWNSRMPNIATVNENGLVTFRGAGDVLISAASAANPKLMASVQLHVVLDASGTLYFADGKIGAYRSIEVQKDGQPYKTVNTDAQGKFTLSALGLGTYTLQSNPYTTGFDQVTQSFKISEGQNQSNWRLEYPKCATGSLAYRFTDGTGAPVSGVRVAVSCDQPFQSFLDFSGNDGTGRIEGLSYASGGTEFKFSYSTNDGGYGSETVVLKSGESAKEVNYELPRITTITGKVTDLNGTGISGLNVQVGLRSALTNNSGTYSIRGQLEKGTYPLTIAPWEKFFSAEAAPEIEITGDGDIQVNPIRATMGIGVGGKVLLDGRTDSYQKAYVMLYRGTGELIAGGYAAGKDGFGLDGVIRQPGEYLLKINQIYDQTGWYSVDYDSEPVRFTVSSLNQERIMVDLKASARLKTSEIFRGAGNSLTANTQLAQAGGKIEITAKYKNQGTQTVTAVFDAALTGAYIDPSYAGDEYGQLRHIVTVKPGESGSFLIKTLANNSGVPAASVETKVTVNGQTFDFAKLSVDIANITLKTDTANLAVGQRFRVYGEAAQNSKIVLNGADRKVLGTTTVGQNAGRWYTIELPGFDKEGIYKLTALADTQVPGQKSEIAESDELIISVSANPVKLEKVKVDQLDYDDLPINARVGVRSFSHILDASLVPEPLSLRSTFSGGNRVGAVTYHFAGNNYPASKDEEGRWFANLDHWRGTGIKQLTASVKVDGQDILYNIAEVTVLIDPSGRIFDADTGSPLAGARVTCLIKNGDISYSIWDSDWYGEPANPWITGQSGSYGWHVPDGVYQIDVQKNGYEPGTSTEIEKYKGGIDIPPPALDVDFALVPTTEMKLTGLHSANGKITAEFSRYVKSAVAAVYSADGAKTDCSLQINGSTVQITGSGLADGKTYTVELQEVTPKSGSAEKYGLKRVVGTVVYSAQKQSQTGTSSGSSSSGGGFLSSIVSTLKLSPADVQKAVRENGNAVIKMSGPEPKVSGSTLAKALQTLKKGEKLVLRQTQKNPAYQFTVDPAKLSSLPNVINFGVAVGHSKTEKLFGKYFSNQMLVIQCKQEGSYGFRGELAVKVDLKGMSPDKLRVYAYDAKTNRYSELSTVMPVVDANGYLHLNLDAGGILLITNGPLTKK